MQELKTVSKKTDLELRKLFESSGRKVGGLAVFEKTKALLSQEGGTQAQEALRKIGKVEAALRSGKTGAKSTEALRTTLDEVQPVINTQLLKRETKVAVGKLNEAKTLLKTKKRRREKQLTTTEEKKKLADVLTSVGSVLQKAPKASRGKEEVQALIANAEETKTANVAELTEILEEAEHV